MTARGIVAALALAAGLLGPAASRAQAPRPFSRLDVVVAATHTASGDRLREWWRPGPGALVRVSTPFYLGSVALSADAARFRARSPEQPDFRALARVAEWNLETGAERRVRASAGVQVGSLDMAFRDPPTATGNLEENEFLVGAQAGVHARVWGGLGVTALASHRRVLTHIPIRLTTTAVGLAYSRATPRWLEEVLR